ncbi:Avirulence (Avh) protein [Phytophthora megakarya]|uniref:RxLR effector protein n=1 Tax=Phytophthora megakarya TaxID=4795 RepID=A0A225W3Q0_9STRA|nr:Avirulence (Avh) protein [Phytophthora megakarya]
MIEESHGISKYFTLDLSRYDSRQLEDRKTFNDAAILLSIAIVTASTNASLLVEDSLNVPSLPALRVQTGASTNRFLRIHDELEDGEERGFSIKSIPGVEQASNYLSNKRLADYLKNDKDVDDVFIKLKLNSPNKNVFENPAFLKWTQYVDDLNQKNLNKKPKLMIQTLSKYYDDIQLSSMLEAAKKVDSTRAVATKLQAEQMKIWKSGGVTPYQLFNAFNLNLFDDGVTNLFASPGMRTWIKYADEVKPGTTTVLDTLRAAYRDDTVLSKVLTAGMKDPSTEKLATELQAMQVNRWLDNLQPPDNVFKLLSLDKGAEGLLSNPQLRTWVNYAESYKGNNEYTTKVTLTGALRKHYNDEELVTMIRSAADATSRRELMYAENIQNALLDKWAQAGKPVYEVLRALGVTRAQTNDVMATYSKKVLALESK